MATVKEKLEEVMVEVDGMFIPKHFQSNRPLPEHIRCMRAMDLREDDVILYAFPRSGTHWMWEVTSMLLTGKAEYGQRTKEHCMLEATSIEDLHQLPSPRLLNTHLPATFLPNQVKDKRIKVIHVYRNVKDVFVSNYELATRLPGDKAFKGTRDELLALFLSKMYAGGNYVDNLKRMDTFIRENPEVPVFNVAYEEMIENPDQTVQRLEEFLGVPPNPSLRAAIVKACSFANLKAADNSRDRPLLGSKEHYRKGVVGDWKNVLTVAQSEQLDDFVKELEGCNFRFRFEL